MVEKQLSISRYSYPEELQIWVGGKTNVLIAHISIAHSCKFRLWEEGRVTGTKAAVLMTPRRTTKAENKMSLSFRGGGTSPGHWRMAMTWSHCKHDDWALSAPILNNHSNWKFRWINERWLFLLQKFCRDAQNSANFIEIFRLKKKEATPALVIICWVPNHVIVLGAEREKDIN